MEIALLQICKKPVFPQDFQNLPYGIDVTLTRVLGIDENII